MAISGIRTRENVFLWGPLGFNGVSPVLALLSKEILGLEGGIKNLTKSFENMGRTAQIALGGLAFVAGTTALGALGKLAEHGAKLLDQQDKLQRSGIAYNDVLKLQADYFDRVAKAVPTSTAAEYLKTANELRSVTGSTAAAEALAPKALMMDALISNTLGT